MIRAILLASATAKSIRGLRASMRPNSAIYLQGKVRVDYYSEAQAYQTSRVLGAGDVILLISGGHGFCSPGGFKHDRSKAEALCRRGG
jgi:hypothetical protein